MVTEETTTIIGGGETPRRPGPLQPTQAEMALTTADYDRQKLQERLAKLAGRVAVVRVGATTDTELRERTHRVEDALSATRAALEEGIVPGGGVALLHAQVAVSPLLDVLDGDERTGARIVYRALEEPLRQIAVNAGADASIVVDKVRTKGGRIGFNALTGEYEDLVSAGVIDPAMVTRSALRNAASIGALLVSTDVIIAEPRAGLGAKAVMKAGMDMDII
ncbi:MAG: TCP-1/cpn60 chaperonin family protein [Rubrobacteraceae bacterium]